MTHPNIAETRQADSGTTGRGDLVVVLTAVLGAAATWAVWTQAFGVELVADTGSGSREIGPAAVVLTTLVVAAAGVGLRRLLEAKLTRGRRWWTVTAVAVWLVSMLGPLGATTAGAVLALVSLHVVVGTVVVVGLLRPGRSHGVA